jgi:hypothetical protein
VGYAVVLDMGFGSPALAVMIRLREPSPLLSCRHRLHLRLPTASQLSPPPHSRPGPKEAATTTGHS